MPSAVRQEHSEAGSLQGSATQGGSGWCWRYGLEKGDTGLSLVAFLRGAFKSYPLPWEKAP